MKNKKIEQDLKNAVARLTPDVLDGILSECDARHGVIYTMPHNKKPRRMLRAAVALAVSFALILCGLFVYNRVSDNQTQTLIMLDVNPSIEIKINKNDRVIDVQAKNEDAIKILDNMDFKNTHIDVAINAIIGSMLKYGYIRDNANSVLLSVEGKDGEKNVLLQKSLTESIGEQLSAANGAVISQSLSSDDEIQRLADEHQISYGKAALVQKIIAENNHLLFADLAKLSVNELNLLFSSKNIQAERTDSSGSASDMDYIGSAGAEDAALKHAGINKNETAGLRAELDYDDGFMIYEVEFIYGGIKYNYEINAKDGTVLEFDQDGPDDDDYYGGDGGEVSQAPQSVTSVPPQNNAEFIGEQRAREIAENHAGVKASHTPEIELDKDDGMYIYEIEFHAGEQEYSYEINAVTGAIISWETD